jgi:murein DD-endopeptidase MepM/ murein hydrolase activator NlpD
MLKLKVYFTLIILLLVSCTTVYKTPPPVGYQYGAPVPYGERNHPGIDYSIPIGTPVIAASDGEVMFVLESERDKPWGGGLFVGVRHGNYFYSLYGHLSKVMVKPGGKVLRGQLIGLSGSSNSGSPHLHFGIAKIGGNSINYSQTFDPDTFWLGERPQCFNPGKDYSRHSAKEITVPVACGESAEIYSKKTLK